MIETIGLYAAAILVLAGSGLAILAALGLFLPDLYTRLHAAALAGVVGSVFILLAIAFVSAELGVILRAMLGIFFVLLTRPLAAHLLARASLRIDHKPCVSTLRNDFDAEIQSHS